MSKKEWHKPQIIILKRGTQDECVLAGCKGDIGSGLTGQGGWFGACYGVWDDYLSSWVFGACNTLSGS
jgi:hypothetical protein